MNPRFSSSHECETFPGCNYVGVLLYQALLSACLTLEAVVFPQNLKSRMNPYNQLLWLILAFIRWPIHLWNFSVDIARNFGQGHDMVCIIVFVMLVTVTHTMINVVSSGYLGPARLKESVHAIPSTITLKKLAVSLTLLATPLVLSLGLIKRVHVWVSFLALIVSHLFSHAISFKFEESEMQNTYQKALRGCICNLLPWFFFIVVTAAIRPESAYAPESKEQVDAYFPLFAVVLLQLHSSGVTHWKQPFSNQVEDRISITDRMLKSEILSLEPGEQSEPETRRRRRRAPSAFLLDGDCDHALRRPPTPPPPTALELAISQGDTIYDEPFRKAVKLQSGRVVKFPAMRQKEVAVMQYVAAHTTIPIPANPEFVREDGNTYIIMDYVDGEPLEKAWPRLQEDERRTILAELKSYVKQLRALPEPNGRTYIGSLGYRPCSDCRVVEFYTAGPFDAEQAFNDHIFAHLMTHITSERRKFVRKMMRDDHRICFSHGDLHPGNILVKDGHVAALLDWEMAGWYPEYWEWCKALFVERWWDLEGWMTSLEEWLEPYHAEYAVDRVLLGLQPPWW